MNERASPDRPRCRPNPPPEAHVEAKLSGAPGFAVKGLFILALFYTFYFARSLLLPVVLALLLSLILYPAVRALKRVRVPEPLGAAIVVGALAGGAGPRALPALRAGERMDRRRCRRIAEQVERKLWTLRKSMEQVTKAAEKVEALTTRAKAGAKRPQQVVREAAEPDEPHLGQHAERARIGGRDARAALLHARVGRYVPAQARARAADARPTRRRRSQVARTIQSAIARYLFTITCINVGLGVATALAMHLLGHAERDPVGRHGRALQLRPYIGPAVSGTVLTVVAFLTFDDLSDVLLVPAGVLHAGDIEGQFITPILTGRSLTLNPVMIFLSMLLWGWMWGVIGALMAVPILMTFKIFCDHIASLQRDRRVRERQDCDAVRRTAADARAVVRHAALQKIRRRSALRRAT